MTLEEFEAEVKEFVDYYAEEFGCSANYKIFQEDPEEDPAGEVEITLPGYGKPDRKWTVPIRVSWSCPSSGKPQKCVVISDEPNMWSLSLDDGGLYAYLWLETVKMLPAAAD